jgi:hypothetical protein
MPDYVAPSGNTTPEGRNEPWRSTRGQRLESYTFAASTLIARTIDGESRKILQPGVALMRITSGAESGKVGPYQADATDGRQTAANFVGINNTYAPWQLSNRDIEVAAAYAGALILGKCMKYAAASGGVFTALDTTDRTALIATEAGRLLNFGS